MQVPVVLVVGQSGEPLIINESDFDGHTLWTDPTGLAPDVAALIREPEEPAVKKRRKAD